MPKLQSRDRLLSGSGNTILRPSEVFATANGVKKSELSRLFLFYTKQRMYEKHNDARTTTR
jgi:hypothetical protein